MLTFPIAVTITILFTRVTASHHDVSHHNASHHDPSHHNPSHHDMKPNNKPTPMPTPMPIKSQKMKECPFWTQLGKDIDGEAASDLFGESVSISNDGKTIAVGALQNDGKNSPNTGSVRIYAFDEAQGAWLKLGGDIDGENAYDESGGAVSLSGDGLFVAIGAKRNDGIKGFDSGHVRVYKYVDTENLWLQQGGDIEGEVASDGSGSSVSLSVDGSIVAIGARWNGNKKSGHVRIFKFNESKGSWMKYGGDIEGKEGAIYPSEVSISNDGTVLAIIGKEESYLQVYKFNETATSWFQHGGGIEQEEILDYSSISLSKDGSTIAIGVQYANGNGQNSGLVRIYKYDDTKTSWLQHGGDIDGEAAQDGSGYSLSLSGDGTMIAIGAPYNDGNAFNAGHVRLLKYDVKTTSWLRHGKDIDGESFDDLLGNSVSISYDASTVAVGGKRNNGQNGDNSGHVRVMKLETQKLSSCPSIDDPNQAFSQTKSFAIFAIFVCFYALL